MSSGRGLPELPRNAERLSFHFNTSRSTLSTDSSRGVSGLDPSSCSEEVAHVADKVNSRNMSDFLAGRVRACDEHAARARALCQKLEVLWGADLSRKIQDAGQQHEESDAESPSVSQGAVASVGKGEHLEVFRAMNEVGVEAEARSEALEHLLLRVQTDSLVSTNSDQM